ncbi:hypothetical protein M1M11_25370 [Pseudomonas azerbaijanoccidens]|uniref:hypothetical protein n=1 Tax=Pseudomonas azerbaijanoccidentalis TaxID=2842347 RepID=UPI00200A7CFC|nr:hypothetical protein [Pseudomonas azerbaijanoccidentalis]MCK8668216.1 hypothetical protein [Pseudomonas azerbaijanoccidentalis]
MQKILISQQELNDGSGHFDEYMHFVKHRLFVDLDPRTALFSAVSLISKDGLKIELGSFRDAAAQNVENWLSEYYGERAHIDFALPRIAYRLDGAIYLLRMPVPRMDLLPLTVAVEDLTDNAAASISSQRMSALTNDFNEFYDALYEISELLPTTVIHLRDAAQRILQGPMFFGLARWDTLMFVEKAMKELLPKGITVKGSDGHDVRGAVHEAWLAAGLPALPMGLLDDVMCSHTVRYSETTMPVDTTLRAHHSSVRLGALIAKNLVTLDGSQNELRIKLEKVRPDPLLSVARIEKALAVVSGAWSRVELYR